MANIIFRCLYQYTKKARLDYLASLLFLVLLLGACSEGPRPKAMKLAGKTMGTTYHITLVSNSEFPETQQVLQMRVDKHLEGINQVMSTYIRDSELSLLNTSPVGQPVVVSDSLFDVLLQSKEVSDQTLGAFDVTVGPLVNVWGFGPVKRDRPPSELELAEVKQKVGYDKLLLDTGTRQVTRQNDIYVDLSAIAKGYAVDLVAREFESIGIVNYMVEIGGEIKVSGHSPSSEAWKIGIEKPSLVQAENAMQVLSLSESVGLATSGDYRNYYEKEGKRISHTLDPNTGKPIEHGLASVTVVMSQASLADALATALNVMGPEKGFQYATETSLAAFFIIRDDDNFVVKYTPQFKQYLIEP